MSDKLLDLILAVLFAAVYSFGIGSWFALLVYLMHTLGYGYGIVGWLTLNLFVILTYCFYRLLSKDDK